MFPLGEAPFKALVEFAAVLDLAGLEEGFAREVEEDVGGDVESEDCGKGAWRDQTRPFTRLISGYGTYRERARCGRGNRRMLVTL